jgi:hypothetical protein
MHWKSAPIRADTLETPGLTAAERVVAASFAEIRKLFAPKL